VARAAPASTILVAYDARGTPGASHEQAARSAREP
jgi:hypothetical protein